MSDLSEALAEGLAARLRLFDGEDAVPGAGCRPGLASSTAMPANRDALQTSGRSWSKFRNLPSSSLLVLFTPVIVPSSGSKSKAIDHGQSDPFETLGLALSKHYNRVRHVPYVPAVGLTETHDAFAMNADAILVVTCEPDGAYPGHTDMEGALQKQVDFIDEVSIALDEADHYETPIVNLHFGNDHLLRDITPYKNIWVGEQYSVEAVKKIVQLLFRGGNDAATASTGPAVYAGRRGSAALRDYETQLKLLDQQTQRRLLSAQQEQC